MENKILDRINCPEDLKPLSIEELNRLAEEIRAFILEGVSKTGGHLATNLGIVELTLALHKVFHTPHDQIVWDVSNQTYAHKIITGRKNLFHTLRQKDGLSGFSKRSESIYDSFGAGHASTSISAALGMAVARDCRKGSEKVISVIGDGAMTGGLAYEALNNAGALKSDILIVLNTNEMSIAPNVGAISNYVNNVVTSKFYNRLRNDFEQFGDQIPKIGHKVVQKVQKIEEAVKGFFVEGTIFEELGIRYFGPLDGHDLHKMIKMLESIKEFKGPILLHVVTQKGKGYLPAKENPSQFHGVGPFDLEKGIQKSSNEKIFSNIFGRILCDMAEKDDRIVAITAAMPDGTGLSEFSRRFPDRFFDVGIAEGHAVTFAAGLAARGLRPVVAIYSTFLQRAYDNLIHDVCIQNLPVIFCIDRAGTVGADGPTHQGVFDVSYLRPIPNLSIAHARDESMMEKLMSWAFLQNGPVAIRYPRGNSPSIAVDKPLLSLSEGSFETLRKGEEIVLLALGDMIVPVLKAAEILAKKNIRLEVIDPRILKPLNIMDLRRLADRFKCWVTIENHALLGGFGSLINEALSEEGLDDVRLLRLGIPDQFIEQGTPNQVSDELGLSPEKIAQSVEEAFLPAVKMVSQIPRI